MLIYLDSSAILKRYLEEQGSEVADVVFDKAQAGSLEIGFNIINTGEVLGIIDKHRRRGQLTLSEQQASLEKFFGETLRLLNIRTLQVHPCSFSIVTDAWDLIFSHQLYIIDALQITSAREMNSDILLTGDKRLAAAASKENLPAYNIEEEAEAIFEKLSSLIS